MKKDAPQPPSPLAAPKTDSCCASKSTTEGKLHSTTIGASVVRPELSCPDPRPARFQRRLVLSSLSSSGLAGRTETFVRVGVTPRLELGFGYLWDPQMGHEHFPGLRLRDGTQFRPLVNYRLRQETDRWPALTLGQMSDLGLARQKVFLSAEKNWKLGDLQLVTYLGIARVYTDKDIEAIAGVSAQVWKSVIGTMQFDGQYFHYGATAEVGRIRGNPIRGGVMVIRGDRPGPIIATSIPLGR